MIVRIPKDIEMPLIGLIQIGVIDRGSTLLQVRPTTICNLLCPFCSTAGGRSTEATSHPTQFIVEPRYFVNWIKEVIKLKEGNVSEINIDSVGEATSHPGLIKIIKLIKQIPEVRLISMQTNGTLLDKEKVKELERAGLNRINLSIHTLDKEKSKLLSCTQNYDLEKIIEVIKEILKSNIELCITPVWIPKINDKDIESIIEFSKELSCKIGIQKYEEYKHSRKMKGAKEINWYKFYKQLEAWEKEFNVKLKLGPKDYNIQRSKRIPLVFEQGDNLKVRVLSTGWMKNEVIVSAKNRAITVIECNAKPGETINVNILETKNSIYLAKQL